MNLFILLISIPVCIFVSIFIAKLILAYLNKLEFDCSFKDGYKLVNIILKENSITSKKELKNIFKKEK